MGEPSDKTKWTQLAKEAAIERNAEKLRTSEAELLAAYDDDSADAEGEARSTAETKALESEWEHLKRIAMAQFPEGAQILGLTAKNRLVAIAHCLGWSARKISEAAKIHHGTVSTWLKRPDIQLFIKEFNLRNNSDSDILKDKRSEIDYLSVQCVLAILRDPDDSEGMKKLKADTSKWWINSSRDRNEDGTANTVRQLIDALSKVAANQKPLTAEEEAELFSKSDSVN